MKKFILYKALMNLDFTSSQKMIYESYGTRIHFELDIDSVAAEPTAIFHAETRGVELIANALVSLRSNLFRKKMLARRKIKKIVVKNAADCEPALHFQNGTLIFLANLSSNHPCTPVNNVRDALKNLYQRHEPELYIIL